MNGRFQYDVIVAGAGPSGALASWHLAKAGYRVALLDAQVFPRPKACGGGLQPRAMAHIPFDISPLVHSDVRTARFTFQFQSEFTRAGKSPILRSILRSEFDQFLVQEAHRAGVELRLGAKLMGVENGLDGCTALTSSGDLRARYMIGADGANSIAGRVLNDRSCFSWQTAIYAEIPRSWFPRSTQFSDHVHVDWGTLPSGYAWVFPKRDSLNVGAGGPNRLGACLRGYLTAFLQSMYHLNQDAPHAARFVGHQLPTITKRARVAGESLLLVGDAAGFVEPLTGEGLSYALQSAALAAASVAEGFDRPDEVAAHYSQRVARDILPDLRFARSLQHLSTCAPKTFYSVFQRSERAWELLCAVLHGHRNLHTLQKEIAARVWLPDRALDLLLQAIGHVRLASCDTVSLKNRFERWSDPKFEDLPLS